MGSALSESATFFSGVLLAGEAGAETFGVFADVCWGKSGAAKQFTVFEIERLKTTDGGVTSYVNNHFPWFEDHANGTF
jgi:hypothetical protein